MVSAVPVLQLRDVSVWRDGVTLLDAVDWVVGRAERWVVIGPNGSGKTTLLQVAGGRLWPTRGHVEILGHRLGSVDLRTLRARVPLVSGALVRQLRPGISAREIVASGRYGALETWWHAYDDDDWAEADRLLAEAGLMEADGFAERPFAVISEGERQQVLLARSLMARPELVLLDEPAAGLDLGARERLVTRLGHLAADPMAPPMVLVTHHTEEIPPGITHAALVSEGRLRCAGPLEEVMTSSRVSDCFGVPVRIGQDQGRWWSRSVG